jgi:hypothetical protein
VIEALVWVAIIANFATGLVLIAAGHYGRRLVRQGRRDARLERAREATRAANRQARLEQHEELQRRRARREEQGRGPRSAQAWQRAFDAVLRPVPAVCESTEHNHVDNYRIGTQQVERICVVRPPYSQGGPVGGLSAAEAAQALRALGAALSPGERVLSRDEIESIRRQADARTRRGW